MKLITERPSNAVSANRDRRPADAGRQGLVLRAALWLLRGYKLFISPYFRGSCRFLPSCADYAAEALRRHGLVIGGWMTVRRLGRCHPLCRAGYDPVPPAIRLKPDPTSVRSVATSVRSVASGFSRIGSVR